MDLGLFGEGALAGYGIAMPVGAIAILIVETGLRRGFGPAWAAGAGAAAADFLYAALAAWLGPEAAGTLAPYAASLRLVSGLVLTAIGGSGLWRLRSPRMARSAGPLEPDPSPERSRLPHKIRAPGAELGRVFLRFLGLTVINPLTVAYFGALILGRVGADALTTSGRWAFCLGAGLASLSWQSLLAVFGALARRHLPPRARTFVTVLGNGVVIALGVRILLKALASG